MAEPITRFFNFVDQAKREAKNAITEGTLDPVYNLARGMVRSVPQLAAEIPNQIVKTATAGLVDPNFGQYVNRALEYVPGLATTNTAFEKAGEVVGPPVGTLASLARGMVRRAPRDLGDIFRGLPKLPPGPGYVPPPPTVLHLLNSKGVSPMGAQTQAMHDLNAQARFNATNPPPVEYHHGAPDPKAPITVPPAANELNPPADVLPMGPDAAYDAWVANGKPPIKSALEHAQEAGTPPKTPAQQQWSDLGDYLVKQREEALKPKPFDPPVNPYLVDVWEHIIGNHPGKLPAPMEDWVAHRLQNEYVKLGVIEGPRVTPPPASLDTKTLFGNEPVRTVEGGWEGLGAPPPNPVSDINYIMRRREAFQPKPPTANWNGNRVFPPHTRYNKQLEDFESLRQKRPMTRDDVPTSYRDLMHPITPLHPLVEMQRHQLLKQLYREELKRKNAFYIAMDRMEGKLPPRYPPPDKPPSIFDGDPDLD